jgi:SOS-response transcriptional repressor LexA
MSHAATASVNRLHREGARVWLVPTNPALAPLEITDREVAICGVGVVRIL